MEVTRISKEILKPSSQTPHNLRNHKLSAFDQIIAPRVYIPLIFFYESDEFNGSTTNRDQISQKLKQSLSHTLTAFYPLAGKLDPQNFTVDCNDSGVIYVEARVHARLSDTIQADPTPKQLKMYLPVSNILDIDDNILLALQINFFDCGGIAIGLCLSHQIADGISAAMFMNSWAATCKGNIPIPTPPSFDLADHFPARDLSGSNISMSSLFVPEEVFTTKRFVFDKEKLKALREALVNSSSESNADHVKDPTRVELVSAFVWKYFIQAAVKSKKLINSISAASQSVNIRKRMVPPLEHVFGNCVMAQVLIFDHDQGMKGTFPPENHDLVSEFRKRIRGTNDEYIRKSQGEEENVGFFSDLSKCFEILSKGGVEYCGFSSWCRFGVYEVDYGWGKPVWVGTTAFSTLNGTILMDTSTGDGIEAYINALPDDIESLETRFKLL